ncbi:hypothetical protein MASR1M60_15710 [Rhodocyclaceae bacterium]
MADSYTVDAAAAQSSVATTVTQTLVPPGSVSSGTASIITGAISGALAGLTNVSVFSPTVTPSQTVKLTDLAAGTNLVQIAASAAGQTTQLDLSGSATGVKDLVVQLGGKADVVVGNSVSFLSTGAGSEVNAKANTEGLTIVAGGNSSIVAGSGGDTVVASSGADSVNAGAGNDMLIVGYTVSPASKEATAGKVQKDIYNGGKGDDTIDLSTAEFASIKKGAGKTIKFTFEDGTVAVAKNFETFILENNDGTVDTIGVKDLKHSLDDFFS